jgi:tripartite-type tricarboxylate transporter receptor subunit TctC
MNYLFRTAAVLAVLLGCADGALAQGWPNRPIRMVVPYTPGGYTDLMARLVGQKISDALGQPIVSRTSPAPTPSSALTSSPRPRPTATRSAP